MSRISVLVPSYNAAQYLPNLVRSIMQQTLEDWELVIVDDGSRDDTRVVVDDILRSYPSHQILADCITHVGCAGALSRAIELSSAPFCTFVGADDELIATSLELIVRAFEHHPSVGFLWTRYNCRAESSGTWKEGRSKSLPKGMTLKEAMVSGWWGALAQDCFRRADYERTATLDYRIPFAVDQQLAMLFANLGCDVMHLPEITYLHLQHSRQMSATHYKEQQRCRGEILRRLGGEYVRER